MPVLKLKEAKPDATPGKIKLGWDSLIGDLSLFMALSWARLIVWLTLRRKERAVRRKLLAHSHVR